MSVDLTLSRRAAMLGGTALLASGTRALAANRKVYFLRGKGTASILPDEPYQNLVRGFFKGDAVTFDFTSGAQGFVSQYFAADVAYLSVHANQKTLVMANDEKVDAATLRANYQKAGRAPKLTMVVGCKTTGEVETGFNIPEAVGIGDGSGQRAYIGFKYVVLGYQADRFFRFFLPHWVNPGPGGYRSLTDAANATREFLVKRLESQLSNKGIETAVKPGDMGRVQKSDYDVRDQIEILGNADLRADQV